MIRVGLMPYEGGGSYGFVMKFLAVVGIIISASPVIIILLMSFSATVTTSFPPTEFSLRWHESAINLFSADESSGAQSVADALINSLLVGAIVMVLSTCACIPLAYALVRGGKRLRVGMELLFTLPLVFPLVMLGIAFFADREKPQTEYWDLANSHFTPGPGRALRITQLYECDEHH